jgi:hypothetical protein
VTANAITCSQHSYCTAMPARIQITAVSKPRKTASVLTPLFQPRSHNPRPCQQLIRRYAAKSPPLLTWIWRCVPRFDQKPQLYACEDTTPTCKSQLLQSQALAPVDYGRQSKLTVFQSQASECGSAALMRALRETAKHPAERQPKAEIPPAMTASRLSPSSRPISPTTDTKQFLMATMSELTTDPTWSSTTAHSASK